MLSKTSSKVIASVMVLSTDCHVGMLMAVCGGGEHGGAIRDGSSTSLPSFRSRSSGGILRAAIIHYNGNKCSVTMMRLSVSLKGSSTPAYKGAWRVIRCKSIYNF
jgi:hypothetical protein